MKLCFSFIVFLGFVGMARSQSLLPDHRVSVEKPKLLFVGLHGCKQNPQIFSDLVQAKIVAQKFQAEVLTLGPTIGQNPERCFNWFLPFEQIRTANHAALIHQLIVTRTKELGLNRNQVVLFGFSAGAAQAMIQLACFPDSFSRVIIHSGLAYRSAENVQEALSVISKGSSKSPAQLSQSFLSCHPKASWRHIQKVLVFHGIEDQRVITQNSQQIFSQIKNVLFPGSEILSSSFSGARGERIQVQSTENQKLKWLQISPLQHQWLNGKPGMNNSGPDFLDPFYEVLK